MALLILFLAAPDPLPAQPSGLREAARLDSEGKCAEAEPYYQRALAAGTRSVALLNNAGNHYLLCAQPAKARTYFEKLLETNPAHANANLQLARIATMDRQGARALEYLARVKDAQPAVQLLRAEASHWAGKRGEALAILDGLGKQAADDASALYALGAVYARLGLYERAEAAFRTVAFTRPDDFDALLSLGRAAARAQHYPRALQPLEAALTLQPGNVDALLELGLVHAASQDYTRAVFFLAQARQKAPQRPEILLALARAAEDAGYYGDSALAYDDYMKIRPGDEEARRDRARVLAYTGTRLEEGLKEMAAYSARRPEDPVGHYNLAQFSWRTDPQKSLEQLASALRLHPGFSPAHISRAWLLHRLGRSAEAVSHLEDALRIDPRNLRALDQLGLVYLAVDQPSNAEKVLRRALSVAPEDPDVLMHLGQALMALDREHEAQECLEKYQKLRPRWRRNPRSEPGMIESATLSAAERRNREMERFRRISRSRPDDPLLQMHLAELLLADARVDEAMAEFRELLLLNGDASIWERAGRSLVHSGQYGLALQFLERATSERPAARLDLAIAVFHAKGPEAALQVIEAPPEGEPAGDFLVLKALILDASGRADEAQALLTEDLARTAARPQVVEQAARLLARYGRYQQALDLLVRASEAVRDSAELPLAQAIVLALMSQNSGAEKLLKGIESRWPEWDSPYLAHGLLLEAAGRKDQAAQKIRTAVTLGSQDPAARCALARLSASPSPEPRCTCLNELARWFFSSCLAP